jgi:hypothetical protein
MEASAELVLVRPGGGRNYELRRDDEVMATVHRRGFLRPRYEAVVGERRLDAKDAAHATLLAEQDSGEVVAALESADGGQRLIVGDDDARPEMEVVAIDAAPGARGFFLAPGEEPLLGLRHLGGRQGEIARVESARPWPSPDPDAGTVLAAAMLAANLVAWRDRQSLQTFSSIYYGS